MKDRRKFEFEIVRHYGIISDEGSWNVEFNLVSWNGGDDKYDIRHWTKNHDKAGKGITLSLEELRSLKELIDKEIDYMDNNL